MRIKKRLDGNQYILTSKNKWVRNFTKPLAPFIDINKTIDPKDHFLFLKNEVQNSLKKYTWIDSENFFHPNILIISDGFDFEKKHKILADLPKSVTIIGVNGALKKWSLSRSMNYYVVNNPYPECMKYLPRSNRTSPKCIASTKTNSDFLANYNGTKLRYYPVNETSYCSLGNKEISWQIDDYRNPICASIGLAYRFGVEKLMLFCCDDVFKEKRDGAIKLKNDMWMYTQQEVSHSIIDGNLYWLNNQPYKDISIGDYSSGPLYDNATYIKEDEINSFWEQT